MKLSLRFSPMLLLAGLLSGALFTASAYGYAGGLLLMHGSILPLFMIGFSRGVHDAKHCMLIALLAVGIATAMSDCLVFVLLIELPALYIISHALRYRDSYGTREWYPMLTILGDYTLALCGFFIALCVIGQRTEMSELIAPVMQQFDQSVEPQTKQQDPDMARVLHWLVHEGRFLLVAWTGWIWIMLCYGFAALANGLLVRKSLALRPTLALTPHGISPWLLAGLLIAMLCSTLGSSSIKLEGQAVFLLLLLPYFLSGLAWIHQVSASWRGRSVWLGVIYGSLLMLLWPMIIIVGIGLYIQLSDVFKHVPTRI